MKGLYPHYPDPKIWVYDLEVYPNIFTAYFYNASTHEKRIFEISTRKNELTQLLSFLDVAVNESHTHVGFANVGFDYPIIHLILQLRNSVTLDDIVEKCRQLIGTDFRNRWGNRVHNPLIKQIDLQLIHGFDKVTRLTSLKFLECNMFMDSVEELPYPVGSILTPPQIDKLIDYNGHDVFATFRFFMESQGEITLREKLSKLYGKDFTNSDMPKIGSEICIIELAKSGIKCDKNKQTHYPNGVILKDIIFDYIKFKDVVFNDVLNQLRNITTDSTGKFKQIIFTHHDVEYKIGSGGIHASVKRQSFKTCDEYQIIDVDVAGYYPSLAIKNSFFPTHLGAGFCAALDKIRTDRSAYKKGTVENIGLKEAGNATYGNSGQKHSVFFDVGYMLKTTINGQLLLMMLIDDLFSIPSFKLIQANTDGITFIVKKIDIPTAQQICKGWEDFTRLTLEEVFYKRMFVRDVNNYIAESEEIKHVGCYKYGKKLTWDKDFSSQIVAKAAEAVMLEGVDLETFIKTHKTLQDFIIISKVPKSSFLKHGDKKVQNVTRFVASKNGDYLTKVSPPKGEQGEYKRANKRADEYFDAVMQEIGKGVWDERIHTKNKSKYEIRNTAVLKGQKVVMCENIQELTTASIDYEYYIKEVEKILI